MKQYTQSELLEMHAMSYQITSAADDSIEQYERDRNGVLLRNAIETIRSMDGILDRSGNDYEEAWIALRNGLLFDIEYYHRACESTQRSAVDG